MKRYGSRAEVWHENAKMTTGRLSKKDLFIEMKKNNIILQSHYLPIYRHSFYKKKFN